MHKAVRHEIDCVERAVARIVGERDARRLVELGEEIRIADLRPDRPRNAVQRALALLESREGRGLLETHTWSTV